MVKLRLSVASKFGAMSGWVPSMPVSMSRPHARGHPLGAYEPSGVAWIIAMSHCRPPSGSAAGPGPRLWPSRPDGGTLGGGQALGRVAGAAPRRRVVADRLVPRDAGNGARRSRSAANVGLDEVAVATPTRRFSLTRKPPAARTARRAEASDVASS